MSGEELSATERKERAIFLLHATGMSVEEIASQLNLSVDGVKKRIGRHRNAHIDPPKTTRRERDAAIAADFESGAGLDELAAKHQTSIPAIRRALQRSGIDPPRYVPGAAATADRNTQILALAHEGIPFARIATQFDISTVRVSQIVQAAGHRASDFSAARARARRDEGVRRALALAEEQPDLTPSQLARAAKSTTADVREALGHVEAARREARRGQRRSDVAQSLEAMRRIAAQDPGEPLSAPAYDRERPRDTLSAGRIAQLHGSWTEACRAAGISAPPSRRTTYDRRWTPELLWPRVEEFLAESIANRRSLTYAAYDAWSQGRKDRPSGQTLRLALGTWREVKIEGLRRLEERSGEQE